MSRSLPRSRWCKTKIFVIVSVLSILVFQALCIVKEFSLSNNKDEVGDIRGGLSSYDSTVAADLNVMKQKNQDNRTQGKNFYSMSAY